MAQAQNYEKETEVLELSYEDNETLDVLVKETLARVNEETLKEAYFFLLENEPSQKAELQAAGFQGLVSTSGTMSNSTSGTLTRFDLHKWDGHFVKSPSSTISAGGRGYFEHTAISKPGAKAGVVYTGKKNGKECAWLLAWHNARGSVRKVYAEVGLKSKVVPVNWTKVATALDKSGSSASVQDPSTGTKVTARITGSTGQSAVVATFS